MDMIDDAARRPSPGTAPVLHSHQGWQYRHKHYQKKLADYGIIQSMSRKGNCLDNAVILSGQKQILKRYLKLIESPGSFWMRTEVWNPLH